MNGVMALTAQLLEKESGASGSVVCGGDSWHIWGRTATREVSLALHLLSAPTPLPDARWQLCEVLPVHAMAGHGHGAPHHTLHRGLDLPWGLWQGKAAVRAETGVVSCVFMLYNKLDEIRSPVGPLRVAALF